MCCGGRWRSDRADPPGGARAHRRRRSRGRDHRAAPRRAGVPGSALRCARGGRRPFPPGGAAARAGAARTRPDSPLEVGHAPALPTVPVELVCADHDDPEVLAGFPAQLDRSACVVMTHDHQLDQAAVEWALARGFGFVGGVGSRAKAARTRARLEAKGAGAAESRGCACLSASTSARVPLPRSRWPSARSSSAGAPSCSRPAGRGVRSRRGPSGPTSGAAAAPGESTSRQRLRGNEQQEGPGPSRPRPTPRRAATWRSRWCWQPVAAIASAVPRRSSPGRRGRPELPSCRWRSHTRRRASRPTAGSCWW